MHGIENGAVQKEYFASGQMTMLTLWIFWHMVVGDWVWRLDVIFSFVKGSN